MPHEGATVGVAASALGVVKIYWTPTGEVHALKGIDALFSAGQVTALVGPSGSGKSSLMRILCGLDKPTAGSVVIGDTDVSALKGARLHRFRRDNVGYVFQRPSDNLISFLTAREHLEHSARIRGVGETSEVDELLEQLGIAKRDHHRPHELSGGEQQRLAFAQAVVGKPVLVVADEPTAELDSASSHDLLETVHDLAHRGIGVVVSTHDPAVIEQADRTIYLRHGAVEAETKEKRNLSVIDAAGRIQLPPEMLRLFPDRRAVMSQEDGEVRLTPP
ncbi:MAG: ABC transporter ATP-binding protein [Actinomycetota bacterium]